MKEIIECLYVVEVNYEKETIKCRKMEDSLGLSGHPDWKIVFGTMYKFVADDFIDRYCVTVRQ